MLDLRQKRNERWWQSEQVYWLGSLGRYRIVSNPNGADNRILILNIVILYCVAKKEIYQLLHKFATGTRNVTTRFVRGRRQLLFYLPEFSLLRREHVAVWWNRENRVLVTCSLKTCSAVFVDNHMPTRSPPHA